ncbi:MAG: hypothetical protein JWN34_1622, partial [Bryobacterales bacterium]|nr:hypothetical protein [Bryobacterales bacterium]
VTAGVGHFEIGSVLAKGPVAFDELRGILRLAERPGIVLLTALRSVGLIEINGTNVLLTPFGREKLDPESPFCLRGYLGLGVYSADVRHMIECLLRDRPAGEVSFVYHDGAGASALDDEETAGVLTRAMADRARNIAPDLANSLDLSGTRLLLDAGGGHGLYSFHLLQRFPELRAVILDRGPALAVAREYAASMGVADRVELVKADIHEHELAWDYDAVLMANILHDYAADTAERLVARFAAGLQPGGRLFILDGFLESVVAGEAPVSAGPPEVAAYSGLLFSICEGRCYRFDEAEGWLVQAGLKVEGRRIELPAHGSVVAGVR